MVFDTLYACAPVLGHFGVVCFWVFLNYSFAGVVLYGDQCDAFHTAYDAHVAVYSYIISMNNEAVGCLFDVMDIPDQLNTLQFVTMLFIFFWTAAAVLLVTNLVLTMIGDSHGPVKDQAGRHSKSLLFDLQAVRPTPLIVLAAPPRTFLRSFPCGAIFVRRNASVVLIV